MELKEILSTLPALPQRQDSSGAQLEELEAIARHLGMLDAAEVIRNLLEANRSGTGELRMGCHCDIENMQEGFEPDECVVDEGRLDRCIHAREGMRKEDCQYWRAYNPADYQRQDDA